MIINRRNLLKILVAAGLGPSILRDSWSSAERNGTGLDWPSAWKKPEKKFNFSLGLASYTFRAFNLEQTIQMTRRLGLEKICLKDVYLPLTSSAAEITQAMAKIRAFGLNPYACGVVYLEKPSEVDQAFFYAQTAGLEMIIASPRPELLSLIEEKIKQTKISLAIHNHGPGDRYYPTPADAYERIKNLNHKIGLCLDIGHAVRAGIDPAEAARLYFDRLLDVHLKDVSSPSPEGETVEMGRGVINLREFLRTVTRLNYHGTLSFEFEKDEKDPLPGLAESVGYVRGLLSCLDL
ncbi:MAG: sugar phosphate isomerase/epimerase family protein [Candidatus Saccharicenans sp.]